MAPPPESFGAHDRDAPVDQVVDEGVEGAGKRLGSHVVGVASKSLVLYPRVGGARGQAAAPPAEVLEPSIPDPACLERLSQGPAIEMRVASRGRKAANVGHPLDPVTLEEREEVGHGEVGMADRPDVCRLTLLEAPRTLSPRLRERAAVRKATMTLRAVAAVGLTCSLVACSGAGDDTTPDAGPASVRDRVQGSRDTVAADTGATEELVFTAVELPPDFPAEFPIAPESMVVEASAREGSTGVWSTVTTVARGDPEAITGWYRMALEEAGWTVQVGASDPPSQVLHASRVDAYLDLVAGPHPAHPGSGWVRTYAEIWKTHP